MDLLQTVRKEGSRGGRGDFKWEDVKTDGSREHYLGHSLMAPVGRWQKGRDLSWYAKAGDSSSGADQLAEEKRRIKEAESDAMLAAMGLPVPKHDSNNANLTPLGQRASEADVKRAMVQVGATDADDDDKEEQNKGVGFGGFSGMPGRGQGVEGDRLEGEHWETKERSRERGKERVERGGEKREVRTHKSTRDDRPARRSRSRSRDRHKRRHRSRSRDRRDERSKRRRSPSPYRSTMDRDRRRHRSTSGHRRAREYDRRRSASTSPSRKDRGHQKPRHRERSRDRHEGDRSRRHRETRYSEERSETPSPRRYRDRSRERDRPRQRPRSRSPYRRPRHSPSRRR